MPLQVTGLIASPLTHVGGYQPCKGNPNMCISFRLIHLQISSKEQLAFIFFIPYLLDIFTYFHFPALNHLFPCLVPFLLVPFVIAVNNNSSIIEQIFLLLYIILYLFCMPYLSESINN